MSRSAVFDVMVVLQNNENTAFRLEGLETSVEAAETGFAKYDLTFHFAQEQGGLSVSVEYNTDLFKEDRIVRMLSHFTELVQSVNILPAAERELLLDAFNDTAADYPAATLVSLFEEQSAETPLYTAVTYADKSLSYQILNEQSNRLAHYLRHTCGIQPDDVVALQLERSEWMVGSGYPTCWQTVVRGCC